MTQKHEYDIKKRLFKDLGTFVCASFATINLNLLSLESY